MYNEIQLIKEKVSNIGGDYYYVPDDGTGELVDRFEIINNSNYSFLGFLTPKYNGLVTIKNENNIRQIIPVDLFSTFSNYQYGSGSSINNYNVANSVLNKGDISNPSVLGVFYPIINQNSAGVFPVMAGVPVFIYTYMGSNTGAHNFTVEMRAKKVAK